MEDGFEVITFPRILTVEEFNQLKAKLLIDIFLGRLGIDFRTDNESQEEFIIHLQVWPGGFQDGFILFGVKVICKDWLREVSNVKLLAK
jgi:hypothetical protein